MPVRVCGFKSHLAHNIPIGKEVMRAQRVGTTQLSRAYAGRFASKSLLGMRPLRFFRLGAQAAELFDDDSILLAADRLFGFNELFN